MKQKIIFIYQKHFHRKLTNFCQFFYDKKYWIFVLFCSYCVADLMVISLRPVFLSDVMPRTSLPSYSEKTSSIEEYIPIWDFNIFHNAAIPTPLSSAVDSGNEVSPGDGLPRLSRLPLQLNGTIVHSDPPRSIADITIKSKNVSEFYQVGNIVDSLARITQIELERVYFINLNSNREEYLEIQNWDSIAVDFGITKQREQVRHKPAGFIKQVGDFQFQVNRSDVNKMLRSLPNILREAKVVPHWEKGKMMGWRFEYIKSDSIFEEMGFQKSDIITSIAGEMPRSQIQAAEMFQRFKNHSKVDIMLKRKGKDIPFSWSVNEDVSIEEPPRSHLY
ncbi:MAG: hypothetical protein OXM55_06980 [Bdellovibrionales bacterium]|nr:hypothetical protein [Bdellovibrionales bacterium]